MNPLVTVYLLGAFGYGAFSIWIVTDLVSRVGLGRLIFNPFIFVLCIVFWPIPVAVALRNLLRRSK